MTFHCIYIELKCTYQRDLHSIYELHQIFTFWVIVCTGFSYFDRCWSQMTFYSYWGIYISVLNFTQDLFFEFHKVSLTHITVITLIPFAFGRNTKTKWISWLPGTLFATDPPLPWSTSLSSSWAEIPMRLHLSPNPPPPIRNINRFANPLQVLRRGWS